MKNGEMRYYLDPNQVRKKTSPIVAIKHSNTAFHSKYKRLWCQGSKRTQITEQRKIKLYESLVTSVLLHNCCCWAAPQTVIESVNVLQRKHLRQILGIFWPKIITNDALYNRCRLTPLNERINKARWKMLGHILRSGNCTPAYQAFFFAAVGCRNMKGRRGRHRTNLYDLIVKDLGERKLFLNNERDFHNLVDIAQIRKKWRDLFYCKTNQMVNLFYPFRLCSYIFTLVITLFTLYNP